VRLVRIYVELGWNTCRAEAKGIVDRFVAQYVKAGDCHERRR
jgi:hypothetical protein